MLTGTDKSTTDQLKALARTAMARYPQYKGHFDSYVLVLVKRSVKTKMGIAFTKGEWAIAKPVLNAFTNINGKAGVSYTVWSVSNNCDTSVLAEDVEFMG